MNDLLALCFSRRTTKARPSRRGWVLCAACLALTGCSRGGTSTSIIPQPVVAPSVPTTLPALAEAVDGGHLYATVTIGDETFNLDGILAADGSVRMHIGGPLDQQASPVGALQFIGELDSARAVAKGVVVGEDCATATPGRFCVAPAAAELVLDVDAGRDEIHVSAVTGEETWTLETIYWDPSYDWGPANLTYVSGLLRATLAEFVVDDDTIIDIDEEGRLFFQSSNSSCVGNGTLTPHGDGKYAVYDIGLTVANCNADYAPINGEFVGLATDFLASPWDYGSSGLAMWLSARDPAAPPRSAMTIWAWFIWE